MKIAFVGKGGSGKSTMTALFIRHLQESGRPVMAIDADLNMNLSGLLGVTAPQDKSLADPAIADRMRTYLRGTNPRIADNGKFLPTTPPGRGSNLIQRHDDPALDFCAVAAGPQTQLLTVGTYRAEGIGQSCYHSDLFVAENILGHAYATDYDIVCDMVAGTDAFAYSLHLQFDAIVLIAEPTPESAEVCALYRKLARDSGIQDLVHIVGNKIADDEDSAFIRARAEGELIGALPVLPALKKARQRGEPIAALPPESRALMRAIDNAARHPAMTEAQRREKLMALHTKLNDKQWVKLGYGDVMGQIDPAFSKDKAA